MGAESPSQGEGRPPCRRSLPAPLRSPPRCPVLPGQPPPGPAGTPGQERAGPLPAASRCLPLHARPPPQPGSRAPSPALLRRAPAPGPAPRRRVTRPGRAGLRAARRGTRGERPGPGPAAARCCPLTGRRRWRSPTCTGGPALHRAEGRGVGLRAAVPWAGKEKGGRFARLPSLRGRLQPFPAHVEVLTCLKGGA